MKEPNWAKCTEEELWKFVASHLARNGIDTILVGGAVVAIYSDGAYRSGDLDFVQLSYLNSKLPQLMKEIGFEVKESRHYQHPKCKHLIIDFATGPPGIGENLKIIPAEVRVEGTAIKIYSPTDCIRDRLASFIHFKAVECMDQAVLVAQKHAYDRAKIKKWCKDEGTPQAFDEFEEALRAAKKPIPSHQIIDDQLDAYRERNIDRFASYYSPTIKISRQGGVLADGIDELKMKYKELFQLSPNLKIEILSRRIEGQFVYDRESISGLRGNREIQIFNVCYHVIDSLITEVKIS